MLVTLTGVDAADLHGWMALVEAVIVAGGLGTRLLPLTESQPKPLLPVAGIPFAQHQLAKLAAAGITRVFLATQYQADKFEPVLGDGSSWGVELVYVTEAQPLGTGGAIRNVAAQLTTAADEPIVVLNSDILSGHDLTAQLADHRSRSADVSLHLVQVADPRAFGSVPTDPGGLVTAFLEKSAKPVSTQINAGCYVFRRSVIDRIPAGGVVSVERQTFPELLRAGCRLVGYLEDAYWIDVGTPAALCRASADVVLGVAPSLAYLEPASERWVAGDADIAAEATVTEGSSVGPGAIVGAGAEVRGTVVMAGAVIGADAVLSNCAVGVGAHVGTGGELADCVLGDAVTVPAGARLAPGTRVSRRQGGAEAR